jgi:CelD/BcsL family acetyltransferase involved in cellulose biosynthesis
MDSRGTKRHGHKGRRGGQMGGGYLGAAGFDSAAYGTYSQQMDHITRHSMGPANPMSAYLPVNPPACILGGKKHRKKTHKKRSSNKKSAKKHRKGKKRGGQESDQTLYLWG